jgi:alpha-N-arabinofuranosidase
MESVHITVEKDFTLAPVDERLFSSFIEHLGRAIYSGIYEPNHPLADKDGFRTDVIDLVKSLKVPLVRYPGGNFLSGYNWTDGIGDPAKRPVNLDLAWHTIERNAIGIDEFYDWTRKAETKIMGAVNMGTGTPREAGNLVEYCNYPKGTYWSDLRRKNGHEDPYGIKVWCIGNEMDGPWQICHLDAADYGKKARETAKIMKWVDPSIELVACGSSNSTMPTFPEWDRIILEHSYEQVNYISLHRYYENHGNDDDFLASFADMNNFIKTITATADYVKALTRSKKTMFLSFDEWNVWYQQNQVSFDWQEAPPIIEDHYSLLDALVVGGFGITLLNNADRVKIACLAQLVNVIAPIFTKPGGGIFRQTIYWPFHDLSVYGRGTVLTPVVKSPKKETRHGTIPVVPVSVVYNEENSEVTLFALNTDTKQDLETTLNLASFGKTEMLERTVLSGTDLHLKNSFDTPDAVKPQTVPVSREIQGVYSLRLAAASWNLIRFRIL